MNRKFSASVSVALGTAAFALITAQSPMGAQSQTAPPPDAQTPRSSAPTPSAPSTQTPRA